MTSDNENVIKVYSSDSEQGTPQPADQISNVFPNPQKEDGPSPVARRPSNKGKHRPVPYPSHGDRSNTKQGEETRVGDDDEGLGQFDAVGSLKTFYNLLHQNHMRMRSDFQEEKRIRRKMQEHLDDMKRIITQLKNDQASATQPKSTDSKKRPREELSDP